MQIDYLEAILKARVYDVAVANAARTGCRACPRDSPIACCSSARTCSRCSPSSCAAPTTRWLACSAAQLRRGVICASAGNHAQGVAYAAQRLGCRAVIVMPATTPRIKVDAVAARGARVDPARRFLRRRLRPFADPRAPRTAHLCAPLRRPRRDRRPGDGRHGDPAPAQRADPRDLRRRGRGRPDLGHRRLRQALAPGDQDHRRRADRGGRHDALAGGGPAGEARPGRPVRRRRGGEAGRGGNLPPVPRAGGRDDPGGHRRHLRGHQGRVRGHPHDPGAGRRAGRGRGQGLGGAAAAAGTARWWRSRAGRT